MEALLSYLGLALGVVGLIASYYFYKKSIRVKEPVYSIKTNNLITGSKSKYDNLRVLYFKKEVENFTVSKILFFNRGGETITRKDLETSYLLRISTIDCQLLEAFILQVNKPSNKFDLVWDKSGEFIYIDFDYLDRNQGGVIQIAHTGLSSKSIKIEGDIIGVQSLTRITPAPARKPGEKFFIRVQAIFLLLAFAFAGYQMLKSSSDSIPLLLLSPLILIYLIGAGLVYTFMAIRGQTEEDSVPSGLEKFLE